MLTDAGMMQFPYSDLDNITEYEFNLYRKGYQRREINHWERRRFGSWMVQAVNSTKPVPIHEILPLPTDEERKINEKVTKTSKVVSKKTYEDLLGRLGKK